ncbi:MAG: MarR family transcriptional regulator [Bacteroidaceae bacterium]|nr:MarR family transcriptional regulator [Bacteroidaceae bacterium]
MEKKNMTYIDYMNQFWRASSMEYMSASEVALYAFIVNECNLHRWDMPVPCSTVRICEVLHMSKQTLCTARKNLARRGLITFTDGRSRHVPSKYSLLEWTDDLTVELTDGLTADFTLLKDKEKDNFIKSDSKNFSFKEREITNANDSQNRRRGIKEIPATASSYEGTF